MPNSKFFGVPFGTSGDKATIPEAVQPSGSVSMTEGFGPDYERNPATDPLAKRVPRDETNELYYQITNVLRWLQLYGAPEWYAVDSLGAAVSYPISARVRHLDQVWVSLVATNTAIPGSDATKWGLDLAFSIPALEATAAQMRAGVASDKLVTPRRAVDAGRGGALFFGTASAAGSDINIAMTPPLDAYREGQIYIFVAPFTNTVNPGINIDGLGVQGLGLMNGNNVAAGDIRAGDHLVVVYAGGRPRLAGISRSQAAQASLLPQTVQKYTTPGSASFVVPPGVTSILAKLWGGGGGGGYALSGSARQGAPSGGSSGAYAERRFTVTPGQTVTLVVGAGGLGGDSLPRPGQPGLASSVTVGAATVTANGGPGGNNVTSPGQTASVSGRATFSGADFGIEGSTGNVGFTAPGINPASGGGGGSAPLGGAGTGLGGFGGALAAGVPGGGGGSTSEPANAGANGGRGEVQISYVTV